MAIHTSTILTQSGNDIIQRIQSGGPGELNIPEEKIHELGNKLSLETLYDRPELSYNVESYDMSAYFEARMTGRNPETFPTTIGSNEIDLGEYLPMNFLSPWKDSKTEHTVNYGTIVDNAVPSDVTYRFGAGENSTQSFTFNADNIYYGAGQPWEEYFTNIGASTYTLQHTAHLHDQSGSDLYVLGVMLFDSAAPHNHKVVPFDTSATSGYTNTSNSFSLSVDDSATYDRIRVVYFIDGETYDYDQDGVTSDGSTIHIPIATIPSAIKGRNIHVYVANEQTATPVYTKITSIQTLEVTRTATLENTEELGSSRFTDSEAGTPEVSGTMGFRPKSPADFFEKLYLLSGVNPGEVVGPLVTQPMHLEIQIEHPKTGAILKTIYIGGARVQIPGWTGQADSNLEITLSFGSDTGEMLVYNGKRRP